MESFVEKPTTSSMVRKTETVTPQSHTRILEIASTAEFKTADIIKILEFEERMNSVENSSAPREELRGGVPLEDVDTHMTSPVSSPRDVLHDKEIKTQADLRTTGILSQLGVEVETHEEITSQVSSEELTSDVSYEDVTNQDTSEEDTCQGSSEDINPCTTEPDVSKTVSSLKEPGGTESDQSSQPVISKSLVKDSVQIPKCTARIKKCKPRECGYNQTATHLMKNKDIEKAIAFKGDKDPKHEITKSSPPAIKKQRL